MLLGEAGGTKGLEMLMLETQRLVSPIFGTQHGRVQPPRQLGGGGRSSPFTRDGVRCRREPEPAAATWAGASGKTLSLQVTRRLPLIARGGPTGGCGADGGSRAAPYCRAGAPPGSATARPSSAPALHAGATVPAGPAGQPAAMDTAAGQLAATGSRLRGECPPGMALVVF